MGNTVLIHDLGATKLQIGRVDLTAEELVDSSCTSQDDRLAFDLDSSLAEANKIGTNSYRKSVEAFSDRALILTDGSTSHQGNGEDVFVRSRSCPSN